MNRRAFLAAVAAGVAAPSPLLPAPVNVPFYLRPKFMFGFRLTHETIKGSTQDVAAILKRATLDMDRAAHACHPQAELRAEELEIHIETHCWILRRIYTVNIVNPKLECHSMSIARRSSYGRA